MKKPNKVLLYFKKESWRRAGIVFLTIRVMSWLVAILSFSSFPSSPALGQAGYSPQQYPRLMELISGIWERGDALWYLGISQGGYAQDPNSYVFMPFYPFLIKIFTAIPLLRGVTAIVLSNLFFFLGLGFLFELVKMDFNEKVAQRTLWYFALFPGAFFLLTPYSEATFFCFAVGAILAAKKDRFWIAGITGACLALTRNLGVGIIVPLMIEAFRRERPALNRQTFRRLLGILCVPSGLIAWMCFLNIKTGDPLVFLHRQSNWERHPAFPVNTLIEGVKQAWTLMMSYPGGVYLIEAFSVLGATILALVGLRKVSLSLSAYAWMCLLPPLMNPFSGRMFMSCLRFTSVSFPIFIVLASQVRSESQDQAIRLTFAGAYGLTLAMYICNHYMF